MFFVFSNQNPPASFSGEGSGNLSLHNRTKAKQQQHSRSVNHSASQHGGTRRQENLRWASELSFAEGSCHWQEQVSHLQRQLDFSTSMCQTLLQDQQVGSLNSCIHIHRHWLWWLTKACTSFVGFIRNHIRIENTLFVLCAYLSIQSFFKIPLCLFKNHETIVHKMIVLYPVFHRHFHICYKPCWQASTACYLTTSRPHKSTWSCTSSTSVTPSWLGSKTMYKGENNTMQQMTVYRK